MQIIMQFRIQLAPKSQFYSRSSLHDSSLNRGHSTQTNSINTNGVQKLPVNLKKLVNNRLLLLIILLLLILVIGNLTISTTSSTKTLPSTPFWTTIHQPCDAGFSQKIEGPHKVKTPGSTLKNDRDGNENYQLPILLKGPSLKQWNGNYDFINKKTKPNNNYPFLALAYYFRTDIFAGPAKSPRIIGYVRRGTLLPVKHHVLGSGCVGGKWYPAFNQGYVCSNKGFRVAKNPPEMSLHYRLPDLSRPLPYDYVEVKNNEAGRFYRIPTVEEDKQIQLAIVGKNKKFPEVVERMMKGVFFLAIDQRVKDKYRSFFRTVYGRYVRDQGIKPLPLSPMHGEKLGRTYSLPLAFVFGEEQQPLFRWHKNELRKVGIAQKHARFNVKRIFKYQGERFVMDQHGNIMNRDTVRMAQAIDRPTKVPEKSKWIHIDLSEQTLVAYRGDEPVFATLVSSGKEGYEPPKGLFRVLNKHVSVTMNGSDPIEGWYEVEEVPWTMYYWEGYAVHGAYWHNDFGTTRSHGCTNVPPADARWLFYWTTPHLPNGWQGIEQIGTWLKFTS